MNQEFSELLAKIRDHRLTFADLLFHAEKQVECREPEVAAALYSCWLESNQSRFDFVAWYNLGVIRFGQGRFADAFQAYNKALETNPGFVQARLNLGLTCERLGRIDQAIGEWSWITPNLAHSSCDPTLIMAALNHLGRLFEERGALEKALHSFEHSLELAPDQPDVRHHLLFLRQKLCSWPVLREGHPPCCDASLLTELSLSDDPARHLAAAQRFAASHVSPAKAAPTQPSRHSTLSPHSKIRVGYCSSDFRSHPLGFLTAELFELHDRKQFEVFGFCWSPEDGSAQRKRIINSFDYVERIGDRPDDDVAALIRGLAIDILVDLQGQTLGARPGIFAQRPAPIQIAYLGLPATTGFSFIDHLITDRFSVPPEAASFLAEKPLYMPNSFMVSDRRRTSAAISSRGECGLPAKGFVYCCFNASNKWTPEMFDSWSRILQAVSGSVLWLLADNPTAVENLRKESTTRGVDPHRLFFSPFVSHDRFLAQLGSADLYLDTFPFNGGTTVNDSLWMGLPVLTRCGQAFSSRMAGSLLSAAGLPDLIVESTAAYERLATLIGNDPRMARELRERARRARTDTSLFNTPLFVRHLEDRFIHLVRDLETKESTAP